ncbi:DUF5133 domain-containing protein [Streptomyces sp. CB02400]|uniref:DUF5133 domain-containing protein n=1 Tax=Streptomyces sp. CB02400 TaxID=1703944 RepID=UPI00228581DB|nr:DUF5133 domain-containing protein [Streptomyces sp. CB02400]
MLTYPAVSMDLVEQYEALHAESGGEEYRRRLDGVSSTLCVFTGTRGIDSALMAARHQTPVAHRADNSLLTS